MIGRTLSHYVIVKALGAGGMGEVYLARDQHLDREVAVKVLLRGSLEDQDARDRFRREAHVLSRLSHPGVATIFDFDRQDGIDFLVMEYVPGGTLESKLRESDTFFEVGHGVTTQCGSDNVIGEFQTPPIIADRCYANHL